MTHADDSTEADFDIEAHLDAAHDDAWRGDWWEIPVAVLLIVWFVWFFLAGVRGVILFAPIIIWVLLCLIFTRAWMVFLGLGIACILGLFFLFTLFG